MGLALVPLVIALVFALGMAAAVSYREILLRRIAEDWGRNNIRPMRDETDRAHTFGFGLAARRFAAGVHARLAAQRYYATRWIVELKRLGKK